MSSPRITIISLGICVAVTSSSCTQRKTRIMYLPATYIVARDDKCYQKVNDKCVQRVLDPHSFDAWKEAKEKAKNENKPEPPLEECMFEKRTWAGSARYLVQEGWGENRIWGFDTAKDAIAWAMARPDRVPPGLPAKHVDDNSMADLHQWKVFIRRGFYPLHTQSLVDVSIDPIPPEPVAHDTNAAYPPYDAPFSGFDMIRGITVELESGAILEVPNGYDGHVFRFHGGCLDARLIGAGIIREKISPLKLPQRKWTAILLQATSGIETDYTTGGTEANYTKGGSVSGNLVSGLVIENPKIAIQLLLDFPKEDPESAWNPACKAYITGNEFSCLKIYHPEIFVDFKRAGLPNYVDPNCTDTARTLTHGIFENYFENIFGQANDIAKDICGKYYNKKHDPPPTIEAHTITRHGVCNIMDDRNTFINVCFTDLTIRGQDIPGNAPNYTAQSKVEPPYSSTIAKGSSDTLILGGTMANSTTYDVGDKKYARVVFEDEGTNTQIIDASNFAFLKRASVDKVDVGDVIWEMTSDGRKVRKYSSPEYTEVLGDIYTTAPPGVAETNSDRWVALQGLEGEFKRRADCDLQIRVAGEVCASRDATICVQAKVGGDVVEEVNDWYTGQLPIGQPPKSEDFSEWKSVIFEQKKLSVSAGKDIPVKIEWKVKGPSGCKAYIRDRSLTVTHWPP